MITKKKQTEALEALDKAQNIFTTTEDVDVDILCSISGLIADVYDMETED